MTISLIFYNLNPINSLVNKGAIFIAKHQSIVIYYFIIETLCIFYILDLFTQVNEIPYLVATF